MRALVKEILARRMPAAPEDFAALQVSRLNVALLVTYGAMCPENLQAVALVVRIVRDFDSRHGFAATGRRPRRDARPDETEAAMRSKARRKTGVLPDALGSAPEPGRRPGPAEAPQRKTIRVAAPAAPPANGPEMAPQALEKIDFARGNGAVMATSDDAVGAQAGSQSEIGGGPASNAFAPPLAAPPPCAGAESNCSPPVRRIDSGRSKGIGRSRYRG